ncbi:MAG: pyruvate,orthophosphate dikinase [Acidimicrobiales bacterium]|jgi:pyruvate,orthophosphate dikinase
MSSAADAIRSAVSAVASGASTKTEAILAVTAESLEQVLHAQFARGGAAVASGLGASPGAAVGAVYFTPDGAVDAYDEGIAVILVKDETSPEDVHGMAIAEGILTTRGGLASHAAVVARGWGKPAVCGVEAITIANGSFTIGSVTVNEGDIISLDGVSGEVFLGAVDTEADDGVPTELFELLDWADDIRAGVFGVRANVDTAADATKARAFGAEGIGLCRTEHQFLGGRLPVIRRAILATTDDESTEAFAQLAELQEQDFLELLEAMDGLPVTIRLLDPPLHEFLPELKDLLVAEAKGELDDEGKALLEAALRTHEKNPMLGTRGVRLGILREGLFELQVEALLRATRSRLVAGGHPIVEIMVPLVATRSEFTLVRSWIDAEVAAENEKLDAPLEVTVGTMVETPRAALCAGEIGAAADFFSFGTNDLTQLTFGFSRDDVEAQIIPEYRRRGLLDANPFETLDVDGVGSLVRLAVEDGLAASPDLKLGVCGEHGGDPASIDFFVNAGLHYVSCSPYRVPVARLAAAQSIIRRQAS